MPDMGQKCLGRAFIRQKMHSSGEKSGKKALIRDLPDMAFRKFPTYYLKVCQQGAILWSRNSPEIEQRTLGSITFDHRLVLKSYL